MEAGSQRGSGKKKSPFQNLAISSTRFREWSHYYKRDIQPALLSLESGREGSRDGQQPGVSYRGPKPRLKHGSLMLYGAMQGGKSNGNRDVALLNLEAASTWRDYVKAQIAGPTSRVADLATTVLNQNRERKKKLLEICKVILLTT